MVVNTVKGQWVITGSADRTANMYNYKKSMKRERLIDRFESPVYAVAISQAEDLLALAGFSTFNSLITPSVLMD